MLTLSWGLLSLWKRKSSQLIQSISVNFRCSSSSYPKWKIAFLWLYLSVFWIPWNQ
jgi:hypothetical protein